MTKQEEIRKGIEQLIIDSYKELQDLNNLDPISHNINKAIRVVLFEQSNKGMVKLHSQGLMIKVKCPNCVWAEFEGEMSIGMASCPRCDCTGYIYEPLIKD